MDASSAMSLGKPVIVLGPISVPIPIPFSAVETDVDKLVLAVLKRLGMNVPDVVAYLLKVAPNVDMDHVLIDLLSNMMLVDEAACDAESDEDEVNEDEVNEDVEET